MKKCVCPFGVSVFLGGEILKELMRKSKLQYCIMAFHTLLTFLWADRVLKNVGEIAIGTKVINEVVSRRLENIMAYVFSEFFAILFVYLFWKLFFYVIRHFRKSYIVFLVLFVVGSVLLLLSWPAVFAQSGDNFITYSSAVRLTPDYWHSAYSSFIYAGCLLFFPGDFMITIVQWAFFVFMLAYFYYRIENVAPKLKYLVFVIFLLPDTLLIITDSYRICQYAILVLIYVAHTMLDVIEKRHRDFREYVVIAALGAFLAIWRNEGIIFSTAFFLIHVICTGNKSLWNKFQRVLLFAVLFGIILIPQKIGEAKYYGKDYQIINSLYPLQAFLNDSETHFDYDTVEDDISAIEAMLPISIIKEYGLDGYRRYNYNVKGNTDFNQSLSRKKESAAYVSAYVNILLHNPQSVLKLAWDNIIYALSARHVYFWSPSIPPEEHVPLAAWGSEIWDRSSADFYSNGHTAFLNAFTEKLEIGRNIISVRTQFSSFFKQKKGYLLSYFAFCIFHFWMFASGLIKLIRKKDLTAFCFGLVNLSMLCEYLALVLVMPAPLSVYFVISYYISLALGYCVLVSKCREKQACHL